MVEIEKITRFLPSVQKPTYKQSFNKRIMWTLIALILYLTLSHIAVYGIASTPQFEALVQIQTLLGAKFGSLLTLGIGPIVTSGIILQLLVGSKIINWDMTKPEGREKFQAWSKFLAVLFCFLEAIAFVIAGNIPIIGGTAIYIFVILQLAAGGIIVILLDELVSKWGFGSGVSLFIAAGVATQIIINVLSPCGPSSMIWLCRTTTPTGEFVGRFWGFLSNILSGNNWLALSYAIPIISTVIIFLLVVYIQGIHIPIPLSFAALRGFGRTWSLKFLYTSNIPVILVAALLANIQLFSRMGLQETENAFCSFLGCFEKVVQSDGSVTPGNPISGVVYFLSSPRNFFLELLSLAFPNLSSTPFNPLEILRAITYLSFMVIGCAIFSYFWINTSGMDPASVAEQIDAIGLHIPGYRSDKKIMENVLRRYIPYLAVLGGITVGLLAAFADFLGAIGTGTGILLTVMIIYNYYEELSMQKSEEMHPIIRKILGE
ncbi:MAG: preprotein translocase subunit SecY [Candidatus Aenigmatarchaeota archaeon]